MSPPSYLATFVDEVEDLLERIETAILALESAPGDAELINQLFRAFHTLKGSAGVAGVTSIAQFTHHVETAMDRVRSGAAALAPPLVSAVLASRDHVAALLAAARGGSPCDLAIGDALVAQLAALTASAPAAVPAGSAMPASALAVDYFISFAPQVGPAELIALVEPDAIVDRLRALGACVVIAGPSPVARSDGSLPAWQFLVTTSRDEAAIREVFTRIAGAGALQIERGMSAFLCDEPAPAPEPHVPAAVQAIPVAARRAAAPDASVRVAAGRLDHLVKLVGELVITQSRLQAACALQPSQALSGPVESLERLIADLRDGILGLRMVPIGTMFTRFHRLIRDLSGELGKQVELVTAGDDTELDKSVIDQLGDAVVHILRNSMDHGLEPPDVREAAGKPHTGTLRLTASQEGSHVVLTISDDGRGIDLAAVRRKAEAQGLLAPGEVLSEEDTIALVLRPGFSTSAAVTQVSGRGVGMDVVKRTIEGLRGFLTIASRPGLGTEIRLTLPLTLAIIDGLLVEVGRDRFIVPMAAVTENLELTGAERSAHNGRDVVALRGELLPCIRMREMFRLADTSVELEKVVIVETAGQRVGLIVDRVIGSHQTVIQPLGRFCRGIDLFSGTTIMGDGRVAMILDLPSTVRLSSRSSTASSAGWKVSS